ncbi:MAG: ABC transporter permease, partial [Armatimonadetes bacterium]|nr:ABC transporter permease [Armatimonadota bacterium]
MNAIERISQRLPAPLRRGTTVVAALTILVLLAVALLAPWVATHSYRQQNLDARLLPPGSAYLLGTDALGRDVLSRLIYGARASLAVAAVVMGIELALGILLGLLAGYYGKALDTVIMRVADMMFAFPDILLAILITGILGPSLFNVVLALALVGWPGMVRLVRGQVLALRDKEFVEAARALGASDLRILVRHLLPSLAGPVLVAATVGTGSVILAEATLSFLGLGMQPPEPSWGSMIAE